MPEDGRANRSYGTSDLCDARRIARSYTLSSDLGRAACSHGALGRKVVGVCRRTVRL